MIYYLSFFLFLFLPSFAASSISWGETLEVDSSPPLLTLDEAVRIARANNRNVKIREMEMTKAVEKAAQVRTNYWPKLDSYVLAGSMLRSLEFTAPAGAFGSYPGIGPVPEKDSAIHSPRQFSALVYASATQPLTQLYKVRLSERQALLGIDFSKEETRAEQHETRLKVKDGYYGVLQLQAQIENITADVQFLTELSRITDQRLEAHAALKSDALAVKARLKQQRYQLLVLLDNLELQKRNLNHLLGRDLTTPFSVETRPMIALDEPDVEHARKQAIGQRPELREMRLQTEIAYLNIQRERAEYIPDVSLQLGYLSFPNIRFMPRNVWHAGVLFQWQPFDWGYKQRRLAEFKAAAQQNALAEQDAEQRVLLEVEGKFRKTKQFNVLLEARFDAREAERVRLREVMDRYEQQAALLSDVLQQQAALSQADALCQEALAGLWTAHAEFEKAIGVE